MLLIVLVSCWTGCGDSEPADLTSNDGASARPAAGDGAGSGAIDSGIAVGDAGSVPAPGERIPDVPPGQQPSWSTITNGPGSGDSGRTDAIIRREVIDISKSPATFGGAPVVFVHPSGIDQTRTGTIVIGFNGGQSEGEGNKAYVLRRELGGSWTDPQILEEDKQIDFGIVYQPRNVPQAPLLAMYWFGGAPAEGPPTGIRVSRDDGATWSARTLSPNSSLWEGRGMQVGMNHPVEFSDGSLLFVDGDSKGKRFGAARIIRVPADNYQNNGGAAWSALDLQQGDRAGHVHGSFLILSPDQQNLMAIFRTDFNAGSYYKTSNDGGRTWSRDFARLDSPGSNGISSVSLDWNDSASPLHGWHVFAASNHSVIRNGLNVTVTREPTGSWSQVLRLHEDEPREDADPTLFQGRDGLIHLLFTGRGSALLKYYVIDPYRLTGTTRP